MVVASRRGGLRKFDRLGPSSPPSQFVETGVDRDPIGPGREPAPAREAIEAANDRDECLLGGIVGIGVVPSDATTNPVERVVVAAEEYLQRAPVTRTSPSDEFEVVDVDQLSVAMVTSRGP